MRQNLSETIIKKKKLNQNNIVRSTVYRVKPNHTN